MRTKADSQRVHFQKMMALSVWLAMNKPSYKIWGNPGRVFVLKGEGEYVAGPLQNWEEAANIIKASA